MNALNTTKLFGAALITVAVIATTAVFLPTAGILGIAGMIGAGLLTMAALENRKRAY
ncbi:hypothetical protein [Pelagicoccus sp. SDUM812002]|uniref:hypothetical protein n=1 Tax=Pelagicoccus sp. SDUM812002 TaxID=3041266 RepID=UPI00280CD4CE|nr:hypothetical protein [Pelagicoccus sp. SDUM812002]MDQ8184980.1 hypothetical protein [Pelagicoccus sp. SDUM812002]